MTNPQKTVPSEEVGGLVRFVNAHSGSERTWDAQGAWSSIISVAIHTALFVSLPAMQLGLGTDDALEEEETIVVLLPAAEGEALASGELVTSDDPSVLGDEDPQGTSLVGVEVPVVSLDGDMGTAFEALGDRLRRGTMRVPALAVPEVVDDPETAGVEEDADTGGDDLEIGADASTADLAELPEPDSLRLDRLSALQPELAFMTASAWVLIRNQSEVEAYLRRSYREGLLDESATGSVSVTLWIDRRGSVEWAEISKSSGRTDLDEFTLELFNEVAMFRAARERGLYTSRSVTFSVNYPW